jgi:hypothetical protein
MIGLKNNVDKISDEALNSAYAEAISKFFSVQNDYGNITMGTNGNNNVILTRESLCRLISSAVSAGIRTTLENLYTHEDFENDIGISNP